MDKSQIHCMNYISLYMCYVWKVRRRKWSCLHRVDIVVSDEIKCFLKTKLHHHQVFSLRNYFLLFVFLYIFLYNFKAFKAILFKNIFLHFTAIPFDGKMKLNKNWIVVNFLQKEELLFLFFFAFKSSIIKLKKTSSSPVKR